MCPTDADEHTDLTGVSHQLLVETDENTASAFPSKSQAESELSAGHSHSISSVTPVDQVNPDGSTQGESNETHPSTRRSARDRRPPSHMENESRPGSGRLLAERNAEKSRASDRSIIQSVEEQAPGAIDAHMEDNNDVDADEGSSEEDDPNMYCVCRGKDDGRKMLACDGCDEWYHYECLNLDEDIEMEQSWICSACESGLDDLLDEDEKKNSASISAQKKAKVKESKVAKPKKNPTTRKPVVFKKEATKGTKKEPKKEAKKEAKEVKTNGSSATTSVSPLKQDVDVKKKRLCTKRKSIEVDNDISGTQVCYGPNEFTVDMLNRVCETMKSAMLVFCRGDFFPLLTFQESVQFR